MMSSLHHQLPLLWPLLLLATISTLCLGQDDSFTVPSNDRCIAAIQLLPDVPIQGNNINANFDYNNQAVCGPRSDRRAVWYSITGNGNQFTAHLCSDFESGNDNNNNNNNNMTTAPIIPSNTEDFFINFGVFRECNSQNCLGFPDVDIANLIFNCQDDESQPFTWLAEDGLRYFFHIRGPEDGANFNFIVDDNGGATAPNDICDNAEILPVPGTVKSTTEGSTHDFLSPDFCGKLSNHAGVWYKILGDGKLHTLSLCSLEDENDGDGEDIVIGDIGLDFGLFSECGSRSCIGFPETQGEDEYKVAKKCADNDSMDFTYRSEEGVPYYVHVRSEFDSKFALRVVTESDLPGDSCMDAAELEIGEIASNGDTINATFDFVDEAKCGPKSDLPGVWYLVVGDGYRLSASACSNTDDAQLYFSVFDGCDDCIGYPIADDSSSTPLVASSCETEPAASFSFDTFSDNLYYIHIRAEGEVEFTVQVERSGAVAGFFARIALFVTLCLFLMMTFVF